MSKQIRRGKVFNITMAAEKVLSDLAPRQRSTFVNDAIIDYGKKKGIKERYFTKTDDEILNNSTPELLEKNKTSNINNNEVLVIKTSVKRKPSNNKPEEKNIDGEIQIDEGY